MTDETRARFLAAIAAQLPADRIVEAHLFPAIRQGGMESGVAVLAVEREGAPEEEQPATAAAETEGADVRGALDAAPDALDVAPSGDEASPYSEPSDAAAPADAGADADDDAPAAPPAPRRYTVYSARYRHTLKGPERGKWEVSVTEEADAPLLTVDAVVRGVQRRSGDTDEIARLSGDEVRAVVVR